MHLIPEVPFFHLLRTLCLALTLCSSAAGAGTRIEPKPLSLSISGGASKGAYEAGLNWALLKIMRSFSARGDNITGATFRPMELASVTGTSAGGINTLLTTLAWCNDPAAANGLEDSIEDNVFRNLWLSIDVNSLLPERADSPDYAADDAMLSRAGLRAGAADLRNKWHRPAFRKGCRVPFGVVVTRVEPEIMEIAAVKVANQRFLIPFELRVLEDGSAGFFFDPADYPDVTDPALILLPRSPDDPPFSISDARVTQAMMTTSAFPVGFGRQRLQYCRRMEVSTADSERAPPGEEDQDLVCPEGFVLAEAEFADGGLFDNTPLGFARTLAERRSAPDTRHLPVTYIYLDPNRTRFPQPEPRRKTACERADPPPACRRLEYSLTSESRVLLGAIGTARTSELYRELTSEYWNSDLVSLVRELADAVQVREAGLDCERELPYFDHRLDCSESLRSTAGLFGGAYSRLETPIVPPFSIDRMFRAGIVQECHRPDTAQSLKISATCKVDVWQLRRQVATALTGIARRAGVTEGNIQQRIRRSQRSASNDRTLAVSSRGGPITGTLLGDFGAFLELKFREYDYYGGIYDAVVLAAFSTCEPSFPRQTQPQELGVCIDAAARRAYSALGLDRHDRARYAFALFARDEFGGSGQLSLAYDPMPPEVRDMRIIHDGLIAALAEGYSDDLEDKGALVVEREFFEQLQTDGFQPTPRQDGGSTLLSQIMADPDNWSHELVRRATSRLVLQEEQAKDLYAAQEPDPARRKQAHTTLMGGTALVLQTSTYKYQEFQFAPSTAPDEWIWRNIIPYEFAIDTVEGDMLLTWQPTWALPSGINIGVRGSVGFAGGLFSASNSDRENYLSLGLDLTRLSDLKGISSWGITPAWYHAFRDPEKGPQDTFGGDLHAGFLNNRLRLGLGARDLGNVTNSWFLTIGLADLPGVIYWLSR